jgi:peptidoglycan/xylan/chitin deacetylase (PgdA/CDA1 family)
VKNYLRLFAAGCFYYSGLVRLALWWAHRSDRHLIILNYHRATGTNLRGQLRYLRDHYRVMHLEDALEELYSPEKRKHRTDRRIPLVLTFDDGFRDNYTRGMALAQELQVPITIFLIPRYVESGDHFWWREAEAIVHNAQVREVEVKGHTYHLWQPEERRALEQAIDAQVRSAKSVAEREIFLADMCRILGVCSPRLHEDEDALPLSWAEALEMEKSGWVTFGAHTMHHPILARLADPAEVLREVRECRQVLEQRLGHPVFAFAYPIGKPEDIGVEGLRSVKEAGYKWALTTIPGENFPQTDPYLLRRLPGNQTLHWLELASLLVGLLGTRTRVKQALRKLQ